MSTKSLRVLALIPARSGSKRIINKNVRLLDGHPMLAYTISAAKNSNIFTDIILSTDSDEYARIGKHYGAAVPFLRSKDFAGSTSPDFEWVDFTLKKLAKQGRYYDCFSILRPTSPFRLPSTILRAWKEFIESKGIDSIRAVEKCKQHPGKMWVVNGHSMTPLLPFSIGERPWHSVQYTSLPEIYIQNASLEIAWTRVVDDEKSIAGSIVIPFLTEEVEGFDINNPEDWLLAEQMIDRDKNILPVVDIKPYDGD